MFGVSWLCLAGTLGFQQAWSPEGGLRRRWTSMSCWGRARTERHIMGLLRPDLGDEVVPSEALPGCAEGELVRVAGRVVRRQRPFSKAVCLTLAAEWGLMPVVVWEQQWRERCWALTRPLAVVAGRVSCRYGTVSVVAERAWPVDGVRCTRKLVGCGLRRFCHLFPDLR